MSDESERKLASADRALLHAAETGEGLIEVSAEQIQHLAEMAKRTKELFDDSFAQMTKRQAEFVRQLRVDEGYSWRAVAETCALEWAGDWGSNQLAGMALCERAALFFGEHYQDEGTWN